MVRVWVAGKTVIPLLHTGHSLDLPTDTRFVDLFMNFRSLLRNHFYRLAFN